MYNLKHQKLHLIMVKKSTPLTSDNPTLSAQSINVGQSDTKPFLKKAIAFMSQLWFKLSHAPAMGVSLLT